MSKNTRLVFRYEISVLFPYMVPTELHPIENNTRLINAGHSGVSLSECMSVTCRAGHDWPSLVLQDRMNHCTRAEIKIGF